MISMNDELLTDDARSEEDRIQEELVAYLDGELDAEASDRVESRLASDPAYRQKLKELQSAWDFLDELPRAHVTDSFTQSTVEMVALSAQAEIVEAKSNAQRKQLVGRVALAASILLAAAVGYLLMAGRIDQPNQRLVQDLPVIENVDLYRVADNVEFLRELDREGLFAEEPSDAP